jgi:3-deoxy-D-manno-octulosonic-acid transferase
MNAFAMQSSQDARRIIELGAPNERVHIAGNLKFEQAYNTAISIKEDYLTRTREELKIDQGTRTLIAGSTHQGEEAIVLNVFARLKQEFDNIKLILAPRKMERIGEIEYLLKERGFTFLKRTETKAEGVNLAPEVILIDTIGELSSLYAISDLAFVGGSLVDHGGQNILEPAAFGIPVLFGPYTHNFREASRLLLEQKGAFLVKNEDSLYDIVKMLLSEEKLWKEAGDNARKVIYNNKGSTEKNIEVIEKSIGAEGKTVKN